MAGRKYVCNRWKSLRVRNLQFVNGLFEAKNKSEEEIIETNDSYGVHIWPQDGKFDEPILEMGDPAEVVEALAAVNSALLEEPVVRVGRRGTGRRSKEN